MYIKKTKGYVIRTQNESICLPEKLFLRQSNSVVKSGFILSKSEDSELLISPIDDIGHRGYLYYEVLVNQGACEKCEEHNGAIYLVSQAKESENFPPFHPNCKCKIREFKLENPTNDPWKGEKLFWLGIMYGDDTIDQKAQMILDFYRWTEFSVQVIALILSTIEDIKHISKKMNEFFLRLDRVQQDTPLPITKEDLEMFGWKNATQDEVDRLMTAFERFGITSRESRIQFIAIAAAESGYGQVYLEIGNDEYWEAHGYNRNTRGAGYIQVTHDYNHQVFLDYIGDNYSGADTASYIADKYPLEVSVWFWSQLNLYGYEGGVNEFIETKLIEGGDPLLVFLKTAYYVGGMPDGNFNGDINDAIAGKSNYEITDKTLIIGSNRYPLPSRWEVRFEAYQKAQEIW